MSFYDNSYELPSGQLVCRQHHLVICGKCTVDFSFMADQDSDDYYDGNMASFVLDFSEEKPRGQSNSLYLLKKQYTGRFLPSKFIPPTSTTEPFDLFHGVNTYSHFVRYVHVKDRSIGLIFTDGACLNNGQANPRAGWGIVAGPSELNAKLSCGNTKGRLEKKGPFGDNGAQTSNRAELRAVLAALSLRHWPGEGFKTLVIATDSAYVVDGATKWTRGWLKNGWKTSNRTPVKNQDMWEMLLTELEKFGEYGMKVQFWRIGRALNTVADNLAKEGAAKDAMEEYSSIFGV